MSVTAKNRFASGGSRMFVLVIVGLLAVFLFWRYFVAVTEGMSKYRQSEFNVIKPDFEAPQQLVAKQIPDFVLTDRFKNKVKFSDFNSVDLLLVNIWSAGCPVCREEVPELTAMDKKLSSIGNVALLTIAVADSFEDVSSYFPQGTDLRILFDSDNKVAKGIFGTEKYPETFVLNKQRRVIARFDGKRPWHSDTMLTYLAGFL